MHTKLDEFYMDLALVSAQKAERMGEVPVGALIVKDAEVLSQAHNLKEKNQDPLGHAELLCIKETTSYLKSWRLEGYALYSSLEPCLMCMGAILQARLSRLIYACSDPKAGFSSRYDLSSKQNLWNHNLEISSGCRAEESSRLLKKFFKKLRQKDLDSN